MVKKIFLLLLLIPIVFAAMKPIAGISEINGEAIIFVETSMGICQTVPVEVQGESYTSNLANLRFSNGQDCSAYWQAGDTIYTTINGETTALDVVSLGTTVQYLPGIILSKRTVEDVIDDNRREPEVVFVPIIDNDLQLRDDSLTDNDTNVLVPSRTIENMTQSVIYTFADLYYTSTSTESEQESVWRYLVLIMIILLLIIWWGFR